MKKYLLYIDILGFTDLVNNKDKILLLYEIIDKLNVHKHHAFIPIIFSDTIIAYNKYDAIKEDDHRYYSMFCCEFAQNLLYQLIRKEIYFRAVIDYDEFEHSKMKNIERYFGESLINCYSYEKKIKSLGLFITKEANSHQTKFPTVQYDSDLNFVFIQKSLYRFEEECQNLKFEDIYQLDYCHRIIRDLFIMKDIFEKMFSKNIAPKVRSKYQYYWNTYEKKCPWIMNEWKNNNFDMKKVIPNKYWDKVQNDIIMESDTL
jgi:hypothetical protein